MALNYFQEKPERFHTKSFVFVLCMHLVMVSLIRFCLLEMESGSQHLMSRSSWNSLDYPGEQTYLF